MKPFLDLNGMKKPLPDRFKVEMIMIAAAGIEPRLALRALVRAAQIFGYYQLGSARARTFDRLGFEAKGYP